MIKELDMMMVDMVHGGAISTGPICSPPMPSGGMDRWEIERILEQLRQQQRLDGGQVLA